MKSSLSGVRVLVTNGEQRAALAIVRSLGAAGCHVVVASTARSLAGSSRFCSAEVRAVDPLADSEQFVADLANQVRVHRVDVLVPVTDAAMLSVLRRRERLAPALIPFPEHGLYLAASDKAHVARLGREIGIAVPNEILLESPEAIHQSLDAPAFPVVIKPTRSVVVANGAMIRLAPTYANDRDALVAILDTLPRAAFPVLLQQRIIGRGCGVFALIWDGRPLALFAHRRIREKPPSGGVSVLSESVSVRPDLRHKALALLEALEWRGVAMVEFKCETRTDTPYLMEVNPRFWGSLQLAIDAGVNFPVLLLQAALGIAATPVMKYRIGVRTRWWWGDVDNLLARMLHSRKRLNLGRDAPGRLQALAKFFAASAPGTKNEVWRFGDPHPFLFETIRWLRLL